MLDTKLTSRLILIIKFWVCIFTSTHLSLHHSVLTNTCMSHTWKISDIFEQCNANYKLWSNDMKWFLKNLVLIICDCSDLSETISLETIKDLHAIVMDFSKSWKNWNDNIYVIYLASVLFSMLKTKWFTRIFIDEPSLEPLFESPPLHHFYIYSSHTAVKIDNILDDELMMQLD